ncbi:MAG: anti-sigma factor family protein [Brevefilum sp.]
MNHQPFESWILSNDPLQPEDTKILNEHLQTCEDCRQLSMAMEGIHQTFSNAPNPMPAPGFSRRWHERLAAYRQRREQQRMWLLPLGMFGLASLLSLAVLVLEIRRVNWFYEVSQFIANFSLLAARVNHIWVVLKSIIETLPILAPIMFVFGAGSLSAAVALIAAWFSSMVQLYQPVE